MKLKENQEVEILIKKLGINGEGIGYYNNTIVFVNDVIPGEVVKVRIDKVFNNRYEASLIDIIKKDKDRLEVKYPLYQDIGAFELQYLPYSKQLQFKRDMIINSLNKYLSYKFNYKIVKPMIGMHNPLGYRNKVSLPIRKINGKNRFGLYSRNSNEFVECNDSPVQDVRINELLEYLEGLFDFYSFDGFIFKDRSGYLKSCVIRRSGLEEIQVSFILMKKFAKIDEFVEKLVYDNPDIKSVYCYYSDEYKEQTFFTKKKELIYGVEAINEEIDGFKFKLYPESFFQLNRTMASIFYKKMISLANLDKNDVVVDAYAGMGILGHYASSSCKKVYSIEIEEVSCKSAKESLVENDINNVEVINMDFGKALGLLDGVKVDCMLVDPSRGGLGSEVIKKIKEFKPGKIVYGSCNPSTLSKDIEELSEMYEMVEIWPMDMFSYTPHVESVVLMRLK